MGPELRASWDWWRETGILGLRLLKWWDLWRVVSWRRLKPTLLKGNCFGRRAASGHLSHAEI